VKKQILIMSMLCLLSGVFVGCYKPVKAVVLLPKSGAPTIYAETGGSLEFKSEVPSFSITWKGANPCVEKTLAATGGRSVTCNIPKDTAPGEYTFIVNEDQIDQSGQAQPMPPTEHIMSIKPCHVPCHP
jgi:hypothetical protein